ncbi:hypothetical protein VTG60DRAFT_5305 [Thermothelomyces hinnuleus]
MSAPHGNGASGGDLEAARRRLARAQAARANATREEIEARGIRPSVQEIVSHMNRTPSHSFKRTRLYHSAAYKIYETEDDDEGEEEEEEEEEERRGGEKNRGHLHEEEEEDEDEFESQWQKMLADQGVRDANMFALAEFRQIARQRLRAMKRATAEWRSLCSPEAPPAAPKKGRFNLLGSLCSVTELIVEVCKHVRPLDIVNLYSVSKDFHRAVNQHLRSSVMAWACHMAPTAARIYSSPVYYRWFVPDPAHRLTTAADRELGRTQPGQAKIEGQPPLNDKEGEVRLVPGLLWLQMVVNREIRVRDIIACLARRGHRLPEGAHLTLKKIWLVMDAATSQARMMLLNNPDFFSDDDLYIAQLFMVKLLLAFNDPVFGPQSSMLMRLMLGQRGLSPLWALLRGKKYRTPAEIRRLKLRYDVGPEQIQDENLPALHGVEIDQLGVVHFEGWGTGPDHLLRPDELIPLECARRQLDLDSCVEEMMIYGHIDFETGNSLVPRLDEMYMSDDDLPPACQGWKPLKHELIHSGCGNVPFESGMWQPKHARKARWKTLTDEEKAVILEAEQEEMDEVKDLDGARWKYDIAWARLAKLTTQAMSAKKLKAKFKLLEPSPAEMESQLAQFARPPRSLRRASNYTSNNNCTNPPGPDPGPYFQSRHHPSGPDPDPMDIDSSPATATRHPPATQAFSNLAHRPAQQARHQQLPLGPDDDDLSAILDEDLALDPIPPSELNRIINSLRPARSFRDDSDPGSDDEWPGYSNDDEDGGDRYWRQIPSPHGPGEGGGGGEGDDGSAGYDEVATEHEESDDDEDDDGGDGGSEDPDDLPSVPIYNIDPTVVPHTPATALSENTDEMLLAQADLSYSDEDFDDDDDEDDDDETGQGEGPEFENDDERAADERTHAKNESPHQQRQQQQQHHHHHQQSEHSGGGCVTMLPLGDGRHQGADADGTGAASSVDWDDFLLRNSGDAGYYHHEVGEEERGDGDDDDTEMGYGDDDDDDDDGGNNNDDDADVETEGEDINILMGGLHVSQGQEDYQQLAQQMAEAQDSDEIDITRYTADEDIGEDERTRRLRDWFRPW